METGYAYVERIKERKRKGFMNNLETERLFFQPLTLDDLDALFLLYKNDELMKYITGQARDYDETLARLKAHIADHDNFGFGLCATILKSTGEMIGRCGLEPTESPVGLQGDIAWMFKQEYWGHGYATEFGRAMTEYGFTHLPIVRIFATADPLNTASINVMQKLGMHFSRADKFEVEYELWHPEHKRD